MADEVGEDRRLPVLTRTASAIAEKEPENTAQAAAQLDDGAGALTWRSRRRRRCRGVRKAAIVLLLLGEEPSARSLQAPQRRRRSRRSPRRWPRSARCRRSAGEQVLDEFHSDGDGRRSSSTRGDVDFARRVLTRTLGPEAARRILDRVQRSFQSTAGFTSLEKADPQQLSKFILGEHPQTIALILAHLQRRATPRSWSRCCPTPCASTC